jgi:hypothetical protein
MMHRSPNCPTRRRSRLVNFAATGPQRCENTRSGVPARSAAGCRMSIVLMNVSAALGRAVLLLSAGHRWSVGARVFVQARKITIATLVYLRSHWLLIEIEAVREFVGDSSVEVLSP